MKRAAKPATVAALWTIAAQILSPAPLPAASGYDEIFAPLREIQSILRYAGAVILILSLIAQGIVIFFSDNIPESVKKTVGKVAVGGIFIGGATAISGYILPDSSAVLTQLQAVFHG